MDSFRFDAAERLNLSSKVEAFCGRSEAKAERESGVPIEPGFDAMG
jgi:hypothetical protein